MVISLIHEESIKEFSDLIPYTEKIRGDGKNIRSHSYTNSRFHFLQIHVVYILLHSKKMRSWVRRVPDFFCLSKSICPREGILILVTYSLPTTTRLLDGKTGSEINGTAVLFSFRE